MTAPADQAARDLIRTQTQTTLFVNAGAGSGKTSALVSRVLSLVLTDGIRLENIAAVTFTEKAGAELRDRLRTEFEKRWRSGGADGERAEHALADLDAAAIGTLHAFAQRLLSEHPVQAGLAPLVEVLDEVGSSVAFEERWAEVQTTLLDDDTIAQPLLIAMALGAQLKHLRSLAVALGKDWDLISDRILAGTVPQLPAVDFDAFMTNAREVAALAEHCTSADDLLLRKFAPLVALLDRYEQATDDESRFAILREISGLKFSQGQAGRWGVPIADVRQRGTELATEAGLIVGDALDRCLRLLTRWMGERVLEAAAARRQAGRLEFHDLLVLARDVLRRDASVREAVHEDYQRVLLDEFQDTDPIQIELAARICGGAAATASRWQDVELPDGRIEEVGNG